MQPVSVRIKGRWDDDDTLDSRQPSQADWIRQYMEQQEEVGRMNAFTCYEFHASLFIFKRREINNMDD